MLATGSLEHSKHMSEHTQDNLSPAVAQQKEVQSLDPCEPQEDESTKTEEHIPETALPPEALGEIHGGPLGCCLGTMVGLLISLSLAVLSRVFIDPLGALFQANYGLLGLLVRILMGLLAFALAIVFGSIGWRLGKRFFREYEPPVIKERRRRARVTTSK
jgi:hypothetical protein